MKRRSLLIVSVLTLSVYMTFASGCVHKDPDIGSEAIAINPDGSPKDVSDAAGSASTLEEPLQDPYEYLDPALEILSWKCVNDVAAGKAIEYIDKAIEIDDGLTDAYKARGSAYLCLGDSIEHFDSAEADFIKLQELDPDNPDGYLGQAEVLIRKGHKDERVIPNLMSRLLWVMNGAEVKLTGKAAETFGSNVNKYRLCKINGGAHVPLKRTDAEVKAFDRMVREEYSTVLERMDQFLRDPAPVVEMLKVPEKHAVHQKQRITRFADRLVLSRQITGDKVSFQSDLVPADSNDLHQRIKVDQRDPSAHRPEDPRPDPQLQ